MDLGEGGGLKGFQILLNTTSEKNISTLLHSLSIESATDDQSDPEQDGTEDENQDNEKNDTLPNMIIENALYLVLGLTISAGIVGTLAIRKKKSTRNPKTLPKIRSREPPKSKTIKKKRIYGDSYKPKKQVDIKNITEIIADTNISKGQIAILKIFFDNGIDDGLNSSDLAKLLPNMKAILNDLEFLRTNGFLEQNINSDNDFSFKITHFGRKFIEDFF